jgi:hypothetical protein
VSPRSLDEVFLPVDPAAVAEDAAFLAECGIPIGSAATRLGFTIDRLLGLLRVGDNEDVIQRLRTNGDG